ncbi:TetR family transcriptional regulator [bacterium]|nr:TetR family transcriptional regulator [bacterium]
MSSTPDSKLDSKLCIIKAAARLFAKLGLDKCSTREIAKQADSNISLISYYFGGKEGLYKEVMRNYALEIKASAQGLVEQMQKTEMTKEVFMYDLGQVIENIITTRQNNPEMSQIFSREKLAGMPYSKEIHKEIFYPLILNFYKIIQLGQKKGYVKESVNPALLFIMMSESIWGFYEVMDCQILLSHDCDEVSKDPAKLKQQILDIFLTGVLK